MENLKKLYFGKYESKKDIPGYLENHSQKSKEAAERRGQKTKFKTKCYDKIFSIENIGEILSILKNNTKRIAS